MNSNAKQDELPALPVRSHGEQDRFVARVRGRLLGFLRRRPRAEGDPMRDLEQAVAALAAFLAANPQLPERMLRLSFEAESGRIGRRIGGVVRRYERVLERRIATARDAGAMDATVDPRGAARLVMATVGGLVLRARFDRPGPAALQDEVKVAFGILMRGMQ